MSRPANPTWSTLVFAPDVAFAPGAMPYSGTATKVPWAGAPSVGFTPKGAVPAQSINYYFNSLGTADASAKSAISSLTNYVGQVPALTFPTFSTNIGDLKFAAYDSTNKLWYVCGAANAGVKNIRSSRDFGATFGATEASGVGASEDCVWLDFDTSGNAVVATPTSYVYEKTASTGTWTRPQVSASAIGTGFSCAVAHDPVHGKWCLFTADGAAGVCTVWTSTNRTTWTAGTRPTGFVATDGARQMLCNKTTGRLVATCFAAGGTTVKVATSDNGGSSWTRQTDLTTSFTPEDAMLSRGEGNTWWLAVSRFSGGYKSEVWCSTDDDGESWFKVCTLTNSRLLRIAQLGAMLVSVASNSIPGALVNEEVVFSLDQGVTWYPAGTRPQGSTALGAFTSRNVGGVLLLTSTYAYHSARMGLPAWTALT